MPIGINSPARNLFLLGSSGSQLVTNFFKLIDQSSSTNNSYVPAEIKYNEPDDRYLLSGTATDVNVSPNKGFGWFEKRNDAGTADWDVRVEATSSGVDTTLRAMELDSNGNLIVVGKTADIPWIAKYSNGGVIDWQSTTNSGGVEYTGVTSDSNGQYYACGSTPVSGQATAFVEKFDANGNPGWGKSAFMLGRDVVLKKIDANNRGEVVAVGYLEDDSANKGYIVKIDTTTGNVLWDRTLSYKDTTFLSLYGALDVEAKNVKIDDKGQIYVVGTVLRNSFIIKYTAEGNLLWQKQTNLPVGASAPDIQHVGLTVNSVTESVTVASNYFALGADEIYLSNYNKKGDLIWRRSIDQGSSVLSNPSLDNEGAFIYFLFDAGSNTDATYTYGKLSATGNGLGNFQYDDGTATLIDYDYVGSGELASDVIGRLSDGSVRQDTSDLVTYPFSPNKILFDDLATQVANKKRQMDSADSFEYSGSPAIRPADFQELNLLGDVYSGSGNWLDQSGKGNDGVVNGATWNASGWWEFDGVDDYINIDPANINSSIGDSITIECWANTDNSAKYQIIGGGQDSTGVRYTALFNINSTGSQEYGFDLEAAGGQVRLLSGSVAVNNTWAHLVGTYDGSTANFYLNGTLVDTDSGTSGVVNFFDYVSFGRDFGDNTRYFDGRLGEFRIYPRALTAAQVFQNYNATKSKYINEAPDIAPKIGPGIVYGSNLLLNYDFGNRATYDRAENLISNSEIRYTADGGIWQDVGRSTLEYGFDDPFGTKTATKVTKISGDGLIRLPNYTLLGNGPWTFSVYVKSISGSLDQTGGLRLDISDNLPEGDEPTINVLSKDWRRYKASITAASINGGAGDYLDISFESNMEEVLIAGAQLESNADISANGVGRFVKTYGTAITAPTTVKNLSGTSIPGTISSAPYNNGGWFEFTGPTSSSTRIAFDSSSVDLSGSFSIDMWFRQDDQSTYHMLLGAQGYGATGNGIGHYLYQNTIRTWVQEGSNSAVNIWDSAGTTTLTQNVWYNLILVRESGTAWRWYLNGTLVNSNTTEFLTTDWTTPNTYIGDHYNAGIYHFDGDIGALRMYSRALTATEVSQNFNATRSKYGV